MNYFNNNKDYYKILGLILWFLSLNPNTHLIGNSTNLPTGNLTNQSVLAQDTIVIDFDQGEHSAGDIVSEIVLPEGNIMVFGNNPEFPGENAAMIFDSNNPTGGDWDLGTPNEFFGGPGMNLEGGSVPSNSLPLNNVLMVSEDLDSTDPDDASRKDISLSFEFSETVTIVALTLLDLDSGDGVLHLFDSLGNEIYSEVIPETGCNGVINLALNQFGVSRMLIDLNGSGAVDNIAFIVEEGNMVENRAPSAGDDVFETPVNTPLTIDPPGVLANDTDPDGDDLTIISHDTTSLSGGEVSLNPDGSFIFTPIADSAGTDTFTYVIDDGNGNTDTAVVFINIIDPGQDGNSPPIAVDDTVSTDQDLQLVISDPEEGVLINDSDPDGDNISVQEVTNATDQGGSISISADGTFSYTPELGFVGVDTYEYTVCDDGDPELCDNGIITIEVKELPVKVFNAFSPNGDGRNDVWVIQGITRFPNNIVQIFNRWGNLIFKATGYDNTASVWHGQSTEGLVFGNNEVPDGSYFYIIDLGDGSQRLSGYVVVQR